MADEIVFYTNPMSRGRIARWMLEESGVPYRTEYLDFGTTMKSPAYLAVNPMGKVPAIQHGETVVTECAAICAYMAETFPEKGLAPTDAERGLYYRWMYFAAGPLEMAVTIKSLGFEPPADRLRMMGCGGFGNVMDTLEYAVSQSPYIAGERFTAADVYVGSQVGWGLRFGSIEKRQAFLDYWNRLSSREAYQRATEIDNAAIPAQPQA
ncbi:glutathione S-transferase family protein [Rhizobium sp. RAF56]|jgi:glutathione S-transferase|uniref:glutathione S-transferase family protein n=1 Tax=Rhizobium sp. RAF56 TaxID=3233062 RepID=UPI003F9AB1B3